MHISQDLWYFNHQNLILYFFINITRSRNCYEATSIFSILDRLLTSIIHILKNKEYSRSSEAWSVLLGAITFLIALRVDAQKCCCVSQLNISVFYYIKHVSEGCSSSVLGFTVTYFSSKRKYILYSNHLLIINPSCWHIKPLNDNKTQKKEFCFILLNLFLELTTCRIYIDGYLHKNGCLKYNKGVLIKNNFLEIVKTT